MTPQIIVLFTSAIPEPGESCSDTPIPFPQDQFNILLESVIVLVAGFIPMCRRIAAKYCKYSYTVHQ